MKITVEFNSLQELDEFCNGVAIAPGLAKKVSTSAETARAWVQPTGAHDIYRAGEYMIWTDGQVYKCLSDTAYSPGEYAAAWEVK